MGLDEGWVSVEGMELLLALHVSFHDWKDSKGTRGRISLRMMSLGRKRGLTD